MKYFFPLLLILLFLSNIAFSETPRYELRITTGYEVRYLLGLDDVPGFYDGPMWGINGAVRIGSEVWLEGGIDFGRATYTDGVDNIYSVARYETRLKSEVIHIGFLRTWEYSERCYTFAGFGFRQGRHRYFHTDTIVEQEGGTTIFKSITDRESGFLYLKAGVMETFSDGRFIFRQEVSLHEMGPAGDVSFGIRF